MLQQFVSNHVPPLRDTIGYGSPAVVDGSVLFVPSLSEDNVYILDLVIPAGVTRVLLLTRVDDSRYYSANNLFTGSLTMVVRDSSALVTPLAFFGIDDTGSSAPAVFSDLSQPTFFPALFSSLGTGVGYSVNSEFSVTRPLNTISTSAQYFGYLLDIRYSGTTSFFMDVYYTSRQVLKDITVFQPLK